MGQKMQGMTCKLYIVDNETKKILAGQRNATLNRSAEVMDATSKDTENYWKENLQGFKDWSIDADGCYVTDDAAYEYLETKYEASENVDVVIVMGNGNTQSGNAVITSFPSEMPYDDIVTYSLTLTGSGALIKGTIAVV